MKPLNTKEKQELVERSRIENVTLDETPAIVCGAANRFATVAQLDGPLEVMFSWQAVKRILNKDGKFSS